MKKFLVPVALFALIFSSCKTSQIASYNDDIYTSPSEEKRLAKIAAEQRAKKEAEEKQKQEEAALAQKAKDDANPYYQDPQYNSDDYYDYKYASQMRRFNNPVSGVGYYDNYYTNSYMYNQNPYSYGSSIYGSYNYFMPSNQFNNYSSGLSLVFSTGNYYGNGGYGYGGGYGGYYGCNNPYWGNPYYNPYYNPYFSQGICGYPSYGNYGYNPYWAGYYNGYNNGYYNGANWGYYNSYDVNSSYSHASYGPRGSNGGGNGHRKSAPGMSVDEASARQQFINDVAIKQETTPKFTDVPRKKLSNTPVENFGNNQITTETKGGNTIPRGNSTLGNTPSKNESTPVRNTPKEETGFWPNFGLGNTNTNNNPVKNTGTPIENTNTGKPIRNSSVLENNNSGSGKNQGSSFDPNSNSSGSGRNQGSSFELPSNSNSNSGGSNSSGSGSSSPRNSNSGGGNRPR